MHQTGRLGRFGTIASVDPARLRGLPRAMRAEGIRMLLDMGQTLDAVADRLGLDFGEIRGLLAEPPFRRGEIDMGEG